MGTDKLLLEVGGTQLIRYCIGSLTRSKRVTDVFLVTVEEKAATYSRLGHPLLIDNYRVGPLGGVMTALEALGDVAVAAGDMPCIDPELVDLLVSCFEAGGYEACIPRWADGRVEPLLACYSRKVLPILRRAFENGIYSLGEAVSSADVFYVDINSLPPLLRASFTNINTWSDLWLFKLSLSRGRPEAGGLHDA